MSIKRFLLGGECDGAGGRCYADMVRDDREGDYVLYDDYAAEVERLQERDAEWGRKASAWIASPEAAQRLDGYRELAQRLNAAEAERDVWRGRTICADDERDRLRAEVELKAACISGMRVQAGKLAEERDALRAELYGAANYVDVLGGDSKKYRAAIDAARGES